MPTLPRRVRPLALYGIEFPCHIIEPYVCTFGVRPYHGAPNASTLPLAHVARPAVEFPASPGLDCPG